MTPMVHTFFEKRVELLKTVLGRFAAAMEHAAIPYAVVGGLAVYFQVERASPWAGRLTPDIDVLVRRSDVDRIVATASDVGFQYTQKDGVDVLLDTVDPRVSKAIHLVFSQEKVRKEYLQATPATEPERMESAWVAPVEHLLQMKLTSFRLKDRVHIQDMDAVGLITPEIEGSLTAEMRARLDDVRATA